MTDSKIKTTLEKILEYASSPLQGTLSRKQRKGVKLQINEGKIFEKGVLFISDDFIRITEAGENDDINTYYNWESVQSIRTYSEKEKI
jgi:hypothetical protein